MKHQDSRFSQIKEQIAKVADKVENASSWGDYVNACRSLKGLQAPLNIIIKVAEIGMWDIAGPVIESDYSTIHSHRIPKALSMAPDNWYEHSKQGNVPEIILDLIELQKLWNEVHENWSQLSWYFEDIGDLERAQEYEQKTASALAKRTVSPDMQKYWHGVEIFRNKYASEIPDSRELGSRKSVLANEIRAILLDSESSG